jgi:hypothetical protein
MAVGKGTGKMETTPTDSDDYGNGGLSYVDGKNGGDVGGDGSNIRKRTQKGGSVRRRGLQDISMGGCGGYHGPD